MSRKPCSSNSEHSHSADSTSASGVALPYLASSRLSSEPALTPIRIGTAGVAGGLGDLADLVVELLDVARVDPHAGAAGVDRGEHVLRLEVDVGDHRDLRLRRRSRQRVGVVLARARDPDDLAAGRGQLGDLLQRGVDVGGQRGRHRLHRDRGIAADGDRMRRVAQHELPGRAPRRQRLRRRGRHAEVDRASAVMPCSIHPAMPRVRRPSRDQPPRRDRVDDVGVDEQRRHADEHDTPRRRPTGSALATSTGPGSGRWRRLATCALGPLVQGARDVAAVQRQQRDQVEQEERHVQAPRAA